MTLLADQLLVEATKKLRNIEPQSARRQARHLLAAALDVSPENLLLSPQLPVSESAAMRFERLLARRLQYEPMSRILGCREFWSLSFEVSPDVLDPRPDSEILVEAIIQCIPDRQSSLRLLDLGTGTGCLLLALLSELPHARGLGVDISPAALQIAKRNAEQLNLASRVDFIQSNWLDQVKGQWDVVFSNPPYIRDAEGANLPREVAEYDPALALFAGMDGLQAYRTISMNIGRIIVPQGLFGVEIGLGQGEAVREIFCNSGLRFVNLYSDLGGRERALLFQSSGQ